MARWLGREGGRRQGRRAVGEAGLALIVGWFEQVARGGNARRPGYLGKQQARADGAVAIPQAIAEAAVARTEEVVGTENAVRSAILAGMDPQAAYLTYGKF